MFTSNPFAELSAFVPPAIMQTYVVAMILMVAGGTLLDIMHKKSARYFFEHWRNAKNKGTRQVGGGEMVSLAMQTAVVEVLTSSEFCRAQRRIAHLLTMYGFLIYVVTTVIMVFAYPTPATPTPAVLPALWYIGALMICLGGYWFWFFIRVDVAAEGHSRFRIVRADLFILSLLASVTLESPQRRLLDGIVSRDLLRPYIKRTGGPGGNPEGTSLPSGPAQRRPARRCPAGP